MVRTSPIAFAVYTAMSSSTFITTAEHQPQGCQWDIVSKGVPVHVAMAARLLARAYASTQQQGQLPSDPKSCVVLLMTLSRHLVFQTYFTMCNRRSPLTKQVLLTQETQAAWIHNNQTGASAAGEGCARLVRPVP